MLKLHEYPIKKALEEYGYFKQGGQVISGVKYADDFVLHAAEKNSNTKHG
jgi:hypothetical protein